MLFRSLNNHILGAGGGTAPCARVIQLHQNITNLLGTVNRMLSPLTFVSIGFFVLYISYYANFLLFGFGGTLRRICFANFLLRSLFTLWLTADINTKAHEISGWLEKLSASASDSEGQAIRDVDENQLQVFTAQIYSGKIGLTGLAYFTEIGRAHV